MPTKKPTRSTRSRSVGETGKIPSRRSGREAAASRSSGKRRKKTTSTTTLSAGRTAASTTRTSAAAAAQRKRQEQLRRDQIQKTQRRRRKKRKRNYTLYYIILAFFLVTAGVILSLTVFFNIETIQVTESSIYTLSDLDGILDAAPGDNLLRLNTGAMSEKILKNLKQADKVEVKRLFPTTLLIEIEDGVPETQLYCDEQYYVLSQRGRVLQIADESVPNVPVVIGPSAGEAQVGAYIALVLENEERDWLSILFRELDESGLHDISAVDISSTISLKLYYQNRMEIRLGSFSELDTKLAMVKAVFDSGDIGIEESGTIDITDPDKMYVDIDAPLELPGISTEGWEWIDPSPADAAVDESEASEEDSPDESAASEEETASSDESAASDSGTE